MFQKIFAIHITIDVVEVIYLMLSSSIWGDVALMALSYARRQDNLVRHNFVYILGLARILSILIMAMVLL